MKLSKQVSLGLGLLLGCLSPFPLQAADGYSDSISFWMYTFILITATGGVVLNLFR